MKNRIQKRLGIRSRPAATAATTSMLPSTTYTTRAPPSANVVHDASDSDSEGVHGRQERRNRPPKPSLPLYGQFDTPHTTLAAGVAIFHLATDRVVVCYHTRQRYWFLPKGRKDAGEAIEMCAVREGFEESGYHNRLLPLPQPHHQPLPHSISHRHHPPPPAASSPRAAAAAATTDAAVEEQETERRTSTQNDAPYAQPPTYALSRNFTTEPIWTQLLPHTLTVQYLLHWYVAETVAPSFEPAPAPQLPSPSSSPPPPLPPPVPSTSTATLDEQDSSSGQQQQQSGKSDNTSQSPTHHTTLRARVSLEPPGYDPIRHEGTGADEDEACYVAELVDVRTAMERLSDGGVGGTDWRKGSVMADVVRRGMEAIELRRRMEAEEEERRKEEEEEGKGREKGEEKR